MARDETRDVGISSDSLEVRMWPQVDDESRFARYIQHSELAVLESENAELKRQLADREAKIAQLHNELAFARRERYFGHNGGGPC